MRVFSSCLPAFSPCYGTPGGYAKLLHHLLQDESPILGKEMWAAARADDLAKRGLSLPFPVLKSSFAQYTNDVPAVNAPADGSAPDSGWSLLQNAVERKKSVTGVRVFSTICLVSVPDSEHCS